MNQFIIANDKDSVNVLPKSRLLDSVAEAIGNLPERSTGELMDKGYRLSDKYDWELGMDSQGEMVLVPLKKLRD